MLRLDQDREFREFRQQLAFSAQDAAQLSEMRYRGGAASYLEVLTNETNYFSAELGLAQAQTNELVALGWLKAFAKEGPSAQTLGWPSNAISCLT
jgi:multidrug efflux system outer membrane protein